MCKKMYVSPLIKVVKTEVEEGFAASPVFELQRYMLEDYEDVEEYEWEDVE